MSIPHSKAYTQGYNAGWDSVLGGLDIECPYVLDSKEYEDWNRGLYDAVFLDEEDDYGE